MLRISYVGELGYELYVPAESIALVTIGQAGELAAVGHPDRKIRFEVERITPLAEVVNLTDNDVYDIEGFPLPGRSWHFALKVNR